MKDIIRKGNKVVLKTSHWGLPSGTIATVIKEVDQVNLRIMAPGFPECGRPVCRNDLRRATRRDF
jgi:hypothetical protein